jgi:transposase
LSRSEARRCAIIGSAPSPEDLPDDIAALKQIIAEMARDAATARAEIARLKFQLARYRRAEFGRSSEKLARETEQLELAIEALETDQAERLAIAAPEAAAIAESLTEAQKPARRPLPEHLPREEVRHRAGSACPSCGGTLRRIGEDITETLDYVPGRFKVIRHIREKLSCRACDAVVAAPAPDHAIARGRAGAGLLAHILVSKYDDHLPLYRQAEIFAREGVSLETSTLSGWVGATAAALGPLVEALTTEVMASDTLHVDDTPVPVLAPGTGKTKTGRLWTPAFARAGSMSATSGRLPASDRRRPCSSIRPTARASTRNDISKTSAGSSTPTAMPASTNCLRAIGSPRPPAGRMSGVSSSTCMPPPPRRSPRKRSNASAISTKSRRRSPACRAMYGNANARVARSRSPRNWLTGRRRPDADCPASPNSPKPSATCARDGRRCCDALMMAASPSTTTPPSGRCAASRRGAHYTPLAQAYGNIGI